jgi:hypothetical protein
MRRATIPAMVLLAATITLAAAPARADYQQVTTRDQFLSLVDGKSLTRPLVSIRVTPDGRISGKGASWPVTGTWTWEGGYLCRSLDWGGDDLGYNCQAVEADGNRLRITSDRGKGQSARFTLR